ncbi:MAG TPA: hypothetical protein VN815_00410 [Steroidobacteraceae bacterium]|jgi:hypothetical protein|nr:hypothetical protein [Steroidobacteraceae bacterium]
MDHKISATHANLNDAAQMSVFLDGMPNAADLQTLLMKMQVVSTRDYEDDEMTALFVRSNGTTVACYRVEGVTIDESEMIAAQCELLDEWNPDSFSRAVHIALDPGVTSA